MKGNPELKALVELLVPPGDTVAGQDSENIDIGLTLLHLIRRIVNACSYL